MAPTRNASVKKLEQMEKERRSDDRSSNVGRESENQEFELYQLVEGFHNEAWHLGVISQTKNTANGKYSVSFPGSRQVINLSPPQIRHHLASNPTPQKGAVYKARDKVEALKKRDLYGASWYPAIVEKVVSDHIYYLIKYENNVTAILEPTFLRPFRNINPEKPDKFELNSPVEVLVRGAWSSGVVVGVLSEGKYEVAFTEGCISKVIVSAKLLRNKLKLAKEQDLLKILKKSHISLKQRGKSWQSGKINRSAVITLEANEEATEPCKRSSSEEADMDADISKDKPRELENLGNFGFLLPCSTGGDKTANPSPSTPPNPIERIKPSSAIIDRIVLTSLNSIQTLGFSETIPQNPHIASPQGNCEEEQEAYKLYRMITYAKLEMSIQHPSPDDELTTFEGRLVTLNSLEKDGFYVDPLRTRLNSQLEKKKKISDLVAKQAEKKQEVNQAEGVYELVIKKIDELNAELTKTLDDKVEAENQVSDLKSQVSNLESQISQLKTEF